MIPQIAPITEPKIRSLKKVLSKTKAPSSTENTKKETIVNPKPIKNPLKSPISFCFLIPRKTPRKIEIPLIAWLTGVIILSDTFVNRKTKANKSIPTRATHKPITIPLQMLKTKLGSLFSFMVFAFIIASKTQFIQCNILRKSQKKTKKIVFACNFQ